MKKGFDKLEKHLLGRSEYDQLIAFLYLNMRDDVLPLLLQAEKEGKKLSYDDSKVPEDVLDFFDETLISIV